MRIEKTICTIGERKNMADEVSGPGTGGEKSCGAGKGRELFCGVKSERGIQPEKECT